MSEHFVIIFITKIVSNVRFRQVFCHHCRVLSSSSPAKHTKAFQSYWRNRAFQSQATKTYPNDVNAIYLNVKGDKCRRQSHIAKFKQNNMKSRNKIIETTFRCVFYTWIFVCVWVCEYVCVWYGCECHLNLLIGFNGICRWQCENVKEKWR